MAQSLVQSSASDFVVHLTTIMHVKIFFKIDTCMFSTKGNKVSKVGKDHKAVHCHPAYLTYMQSTSCETLGWMNLKLELRLLGEISTTSDLQMIPL